MAANKTIYTVYRYLGKRSLTERGDCSSPFLTEKSTTKQRENASRSTGYASRDRAWASVSRLHQLPSRQLQALIDPHAWIPEKLADHDLATLESLKATAMSPTLLRNPASKCKDNNVCICQCKIEKMMMEANTNVCRCAMLIVTRRLTRADIPLTECYHPGKRILIVLHSYSVHPEKAALVF